jgi:glutaredoxin
MLYKKLVIYYKPQCFYCHQQLQWLDKNKVLFEKRNIEKTAFAEEFKTRNGKGYPLSVISFGDGKEKEVLGFNEKLLMKYLNVISKG